MPPLLEPAGFADLPRWALDDPGEVIRAMSRCAEHVIHVKPYRTGELGILAAELLPALADAAGQVGDLSAEEARAFFESRFRPFLVRPEKSRQGFVTGYYEPELAVSETRDARFRFPVYRRPEDLIDLDETNRPPDMDPCLVFGRSSDRGITDYFDRGEIERGALEGRRLELAFAESKVDLFFVHIQGAARLVYPDGRQNRITYAAKTGHPFTPIGRILIERGEIAREAVTMDAIRAWLAARPDQVDDLLWQNRSFIFFRSAPVGDPALGPIAAAKVPLSAGRSLAVDRLIHTFGTPIYVSAPTLTHLDDGAPFARLMLAQDTGSAIIGAARGDIFTGSGEAAGVLAGSVRHPADFFVFLPAAAVDRLTP